MDEKNAHTVILVSKPLDPLGLGGQSSPAAGLVGQTATMSLW